MLQPRKFGGKSDHFIEIEIESASYLQIAKFLDLGTNHSTIMESGPDLAWKSACDDFFFYILMAKWIPGGGGTRPENDHTFGPKFGFQNQTLTVQ